MLQTLLLFHSQFYLFLSHPGLCPRISPYLHEFGGRGICFGATWFTPDSGFKNHSWQDDWMVLVTWFPYKVPCVLSHWLHGIFVMALDTFSQSLFIFENMLSLSLVPGEIFPGDYFLLLQNMALDYYYRSIQIPPTTVCFFFFSQFQHFSFNHIIASRIQQILQFFLAPWYSLYKISDP